jgi:uncharacterized membrane protein (DUF4010 family)
LQASPEAENRVTMQVIRKTIVSRTVVTGALAARKWPLPRPATSAYDAFVADGNRPLDNPAMITFPELAERFAVALGIGLLIGLERGWRQREQKPGSRTAGIRTFTITGLLGGIIGALASAAGEGMAIVLATGFVTFASVFGFFSWQENRADRSFSATTAVAGMLTFALGAYALIGDMRIAAAAAVAAAGILAIREELHGWIEQITWPELRSGLVLLTMTVIALPIVPDQPIGPFGGVNPREVWLIAVILASVQFLGYIAVRGLGATAGVLLAAAAGGLVSSTAVTVASARSAAAGDGRHLVLVAAVAIATAISFSRVFAIAAFLNPAVLMLIAPALLAGIAAAIVFAAVAVIWRRPGRGRPAMKLSNPFEFWWVVGFAVFLGAIIILGRLVGESYGATGATIGAIFVGLADVDSVTVAISRLAPSTLSNWNAAVAILAAVASDTVSKVAIGAALGRGRFARDIVLLAALCLVAGGLAVWATAILVPR